jgi:hypothetical protein
LKCLVGYENLGGKFVRTIWFGWTSAVVALAACAGEIPAGHLLEVRLTSGLASDRSKPGDRVSAELISPLFDGETMLAPVGTMVQGTVRKAAPLGFALRRGRASLGLEFDRLVLPSGQDIPIRATLAKVDTAREELGASGDVDGISPAVSVSSALAAYAWRLVLLEPGLGVAVWAVKFAFAPAPDPEVRLPAGTELLVKLKDPAILPDPIESVRVAPLDIECAAEFRQTLEQSPARVTRTSGEPGDRINLLIAGQADAVQRAFEAAGWSASEKKTATSIAKTYYKMVKRQGYPTGPMSIMTFQGNDPDFAFQKTMNTYARRHHLRIWRVGVTSWGDPLWASAATEDVDIQFSKQAKSFTHAIDANIDNERAKVLSDLLYTNCVEETSLIEMVPLDTPEFITDGAVAGLRLNACEEPRRMAAAAPAPRGNVLMRGMKALYQDAIRSSINQIAITGAHVPPQAFAAKPEPQDHRGDWAQQQATLLSRRAAVE